MIRFCSKIIRGAYSFLSVPIPISGIDTAILLKELENLVREEEDAEERARWEAIMRIIQIAITRAEMSKAGGPDDLLPPREIPGLQEGRSLRQTVLRDREGEGSSPKR